MAFVAAEALVRDAILNARLDAPKRPWQELLAEVLSDGDKFWWRGSKGIDLDVVVRVFCKLHRLSEKVVQAEVLRVAAKWPAIDRLQIPWRKS